MTRQTAKRITRLTAVLGAVVLASGALLAGGPGSAPAQALDLPTWDEVQAAKANTAATAAKVTEIEGLLTQSAQELDRLRNLQASAMAEFQKAEREFQSAAQRSADLDAQAAQSQAEADAAAEQAASLVAQMYRSGGVDRSMELFLETDGDTADALLERLASMSKATERNTTVSAQAEQAMNTAASLGEQAQAAEEERQTLAAEKERLEAEATAAVAVQADAVAQQEEQQKVLETQLAALQDTEATTVAGYQERLRVEEEERQERARQAAAAAAAAAAEAAANAGGGGGGGGSSSGGGGGGGSSSSGWVVPIPYSYISTYFQQWWGHTGVDLVNGCGTPIVAANSGVIAGAGWLDPLGGNMIYLNHGGGYQTRYAHLSGFAVSYGQSVSAGQVIGYVGTTGASTGCHLHYEVLSGGVFIDPYGNGFV